MILTSFLRTTLDPLPDYRFGNSVGIDSGNNYSWRRQVNGSEGTAINQSLIINSADGSDSYANGLQVGYLANFNTKEKLLISHLVHNKTSSGDEAPSRNELTGKWTETTDPANDIQIVDANGHNFDTDSQLVVLGWDPADIHLDNFWEELATDTLTATDSNVQLTLSTARKYLWVQAYLKPTATLVPWLRFNNVSTGTPYDYRKSDNGAADVKSTGQNQMVIGLSESTPQFVNIFIINVSAKEKLVIAHSVGQNAAGAGNVPTRRETVAKHAFTAGLTTEVDFVSSTSSFASGSEFKVWGHD